MTDPTIKDLTDNELLEINRGMHRSFPRESAGLFSTLLHSLFIETDIPYYLLSKMGLSEPYKRAEYFETIPIARKWNEFQPMDFTSLQWRLGEKIPDDVKKGRFDCRVECVNYKKASDIHAIETASVLNVIPQGWVDELSYIAFRVSITRKGSYMDYGDGQKYDEVVKFYDPVNNAFYTLEKKTLFRIAEAFFRFVYIEPSYFTVSTRAHQMLYTLITRKILAHDFLGIVFDEVRKNMGLYFKMLMYNMLLDWLSLRATEKSLVNTPFANPPLNALKEQADVKVEPPPPEVLEPTTEEEQPKPKSKSGRKRATVVKKNYVEGRTT